MYYLFLKRILDYNFFQITHAYKYMKLFLPIQQIFIPYLRQLRKKKHDNKAECTLSSCETEILLRTCRSILPSLWQASSRIDDQYRLILSNSHFSAVAYYSLWSGYRENENRINKG